MRWPWQKNKPNDSIIRHLPGDSPPPEISFGDAELMEGIGAHIERHVGPIGPVLHELLSPHVHIDVHVVHPGPGREFLTLCTSGGAELPMNSPQGLQGDWRYAELLCLLPPDWRLDPESVNDERWYFPVRWLKTFARLPHQCKTWIHYGHTLPNGDPPKPYAPGVDLCCVGLLLPLAFNREFFELNLPDRLVHFWMMVPLYPEEVTYKLNHGMEALEKRLAPVIEQVGIHGLWVPGRPNACRA